MDETWRPALDVHERAGRCRLVLAGCAYGDGETLQEAADDLVARLLDIALCIRTSGFRLPSELGPPDARVLGFIWRLGELAVQGEDIRDHVFGTPKAA